MVISFSGMLTKDLSYVYMSFLLMGIYFLALDVESFRQREGFVLYYSPIYILMFTVVLISNKL